MIKLKYKLSGMELDSSYAEKMQTLLDKTNSKNKTELICRLIDFAISHINELVINKND